MMKNSLAKILFLLIKLVPASYLTLKLRLATFMVEKVLKQAPQTAASNKKLEKEFKGRYGKT